MNIKLNPLAKQISTLHTAHFASSKQTEGKTASTTNSDRVTFSSKGQEAANSNIETLADKVAAQIGTITKEDFMEQIKQLQSKNQLKVDPYRTVDPDGSIARKTYFETYIGQLIKQEDSIKNYYADAYNEAVSSTIDSLSFISGKYLCSWSDYFDPSIPEKERQWTHHQLYAMLTDTHVALNDPYALAASGGAKTVTQMDKIAKQAVKNKLDMLLKEHSNY
ncbi:hypothetical protein [Clostridium sp. MD294]|uniref:hypothetical protein n=1 Tax=Clostridium sp. MD294 TaxID=97138 RepID=UPI0002C90F2B|nr:hypothetical protein [Clostridium sp. MD294]NDO46311.1 hypothetical protein [Clostridium sp. MD294]USF29262.1 hypothetical protein C820_000647 [Clostridium sp. MD294]